MTTARLSDHSKQLPRSRPSAAFRKLAALEPELERIRQTALALSKEYPPSDWCRIKYYHYGTGDHRYMPFFAVVRILVGPQSGNAGSILGTPAAHDIVADTIMAALPDGECKCCERCDLD